MGRPYLQFYTGDYLRDPGVRSVSLAARGLWTDMLCLMHQSARRGYLQHTSGHPFTPVQLARMVGHSAEEISPLLQELEDSSVFSRTSHGVIYSRRMVRDERKRELCAAAGKRGGGNPALASPELPLKDTFIGGPKGGVKGSPKGTFKPHIQSQKSEEISEAKASSSAAGAADGATAVPCAEVVDLFHQHCPSLPRLRALTDQRRAAIRVRWKALAKAGQDPGAGFLELFQAAEASDFLSGRNGQWTGCSFDWLLTPTRAQKVLEGNYHNDRQLFRTAPTVKEPQERTYDDTEL